MNCMLLQLFTEISLLDWYILKLIWFSDYYLRNNRTPKTIVIDVHKKYQEKQKSNNIRRCFHTHFQSDLEWSNFGVAISQLC